MGGKERQGAHRRGESIVEIANNLYMMGKEEKAINILRNRLSREPQDPAGWLALSTMLDAEKRDSEAVEAYRAGREANPGNPVFVQMASMGIVSLLIEMGDFKSAKAEGLNLLRTFAPGQENDPGAYALIGYCSLQMGQYEDALKWFDTRLAINYDFRTMHHKGEALIHLGRWKEAADAFTSVIETGQLDSAWMWRGLAKAFSGDLDGGLADVQHCLEKNPLYHKAWCAKGIIMSKEGDYFSAAACFKHALRVKPENHAARLGLNAALHSRVLDFPRVVPD